MKSLTLIRALLLGMALAAGMLVSPAAAQTNPEVTYDLDFSTDLNLLLNPTDATAQRFAMWKSPTQLASLRSAPMIRLTNRADSDLKITQIRLDLGDPTAQFDSV